MVVVMKRDATQADIERVSEKVRDAGGEAFVSRGAVHTIIGLVGDTASFMGLGLDNFPGVDHLIQVGKPYKMVARALHPQPTTVKVGPAAVGRETFTIIAGPCAVESEGQALAAARGAKAAGATILRGGAFKPRTSPYSFQGLGERGLEILARCREDTGLPVVTEVMEPRDVELVASWADALQVGTRNMQNFALLREVGATSKPVLLKRGFSATVEEWLMAAEYVAQRGNSEIILCERGIRTFETATRNTLDLGGMVVAQQESHLPVIVDPSHAMGVRELVAPMARAAIAAGADGVMVDVHHDPGEALCDGPQALTPADLL
ncbi:MAG TPA: 3-deoxy-7-phosphoheptulonate synthase, partial [Actinomycetota bacterium]|nr:3-deoxy-7-phosphoheptulonate synthase [Actinomycetota bacterium]